jgi:carotenoid cleavage dioxygenase-like enzyme
MNVEVVGRVESTLPAEDDHPYRSGAWQPNFVEYNATDLEVIGDLPDDLEGVYIRNTENPIHESIGVYHPFDGDSMLHLLHFGGGSVEYRNRFVRTDGLIAEVEAGEALWSGVMEPGKGRPDGRGVRNWVKDVSSTDVVVHAGKVATSFHECGDLYRLDPVTLDQFGKETWNGAFPSDCGVSAHTKVDEHTGEMLFFNYGTDAPFMHYGVVNEKNELVHYVDVPLPGPRLCHDMGFTKNYSILTDFPLFWDPDLLASGIYALRYFPDLPTRFAIIPRLGRTEDVRWFEASPTWVMHFINAYEDGDEVVLDGFYQDEPSPRIRNGGGDYQGAYERVVRYMDIANDCRTHAYRWRFNMATGETKEESLTDVISEFGMVNGRHGGRPYRYTYTMTQKPGWFLLDGILKLDVASGVKDTYRFEDGVFGSETAMAPRVGSQGEDDGYLVTIVTDLNNDRSEGWVLSADDVAAGPLARIVLPERVSSGTHACWAPQSSFH